MFDDTLVFLETETTSNDVSFVSVSDYPDGVPVFDLAVVESDGTVRRFKKDALVDEYLNLDDGTTLVAFITTNTYDEKGITSCQKYGPNEQYVTFVPDEKRASNRSLIAFYSA
jgi:hypothetical protein